MLARQGGDPEVVRRNGPSRGTQRGEYVAVVTRGPLVRFEQEHPGRGHESGELLTGLMRARARGKAGEQLAEDDERKVDFDRRPQCLYRSGQAAHKTAVDIGIQRDRAHRRARRFRRLTRYAALGCSAQRLASISENGATAAANVSASALDQRPASASRSSKASLPALPRCKVSTMSRLTLMPRRRASALRRDSVAASRPRRRRFGIAHR